MNKMVPTKTTVSSGQITSTKLTAPSSPSAASTAAPAPTAAQVKPAVPTPTQVGEIPPELPPAIERPLIQVSGPPKEIELPPASFENPPLGTTSVKPEELQRIVLAEVTNPSKPQPTAPAKVDPAVVKASHVEPSPPKAEAAKPEPAKPPSPAPAPPKTPDQIWREALEQLQAVAKEKANHPNNESSALWNFRARLISWLAEPAIDPEAGSPEQLATWRTLGRALQAVALGREEAASKAHEIRDAVSALETYAPLEMVDLALARKVHSFADYEPLDPPVRKAGQPVVLYAELNGLTFEPGSGDFRSRLSSRVEILANPGQPPVWSMSLGTAEDRCKRRRRDFYINNRFNLPDSLKPGTYVVRSIQTDLISGKTVAKEVSLTIQP